jgi:hypothetical protein
MIFPHQYISSEEQSQRLYTRRLGKFKQDLARILQGEVGMMEDRKEMSLYQLLTIYTEIHRVRISDLVREVVGE